MDHPAQGHGRKGRRDEGSLRPISSASPLVRSLMQAVIEGVDMPAAPAAGPNARIGDILIENGAIASDGLIRALALQPRSQARVGDILVATGAADRAAVLRAAAAQFGLPFADLAAMPKIGFAAAPGDLDAYLRHGVVPLDVEGGARLIAASDPDAAAAYAPRARVVIADERALRRKMVDKFSTPLAARAAARRPEATSLRRGAAKWQRLIPWVLGATAAISAAAAPHLALTGLLWLSAGILGVNAALWCASLLASFTSDADADVTVVEGATQLADFRPSPKVSVLIPLYREPEMAAHLVAAIARLDYPPELLDVKIVLEADDDETAAAIAAAEPPPFIDVLTAPEGAPRTKPRALNFALDFAKGDVIGVYDAEDRPPPEQIRDVVAAFAAAPPDVACVQARLGYYNTDENWLTRCFEIEYASWFDVMLPGLHRMSMPLPLGGTSLFVRRRALEEVGGWDSHNVTEDADLGMLLARRGMRTILSQSLTEEEASSRPGAWIRQRSRWLKGYLATWTTHMRNPASLWRDLGPAGFIGFNTILLSAALGYLALPFLWGAVLLGETMTRGAPSAETALTAVQVAAFLPLPFLLAAAIKGLRRRRKGRLWIWALTAPAYWCLGAVAAYLAIWELAVAPTKWRKTRHGVGRIASRLRSEVAAAREETPPRPRRAAG